MQVIYAIGMFIAELIGAGHPHRRVTITAATAATAAPTVSITSGPSGVMNSQDATFAWSANESVSWTCSLNGAAYSSCGVASGTTGGTSYVGLAASSGVQTFAVRGTDASSNVGTSDTASWFIGLPPLSCDASTSCAVSFVADDYSGSGNWQSRDSNAWVGVLTGAVGVTGSTTFTGRSEIGPFSSSNYFTVAASGPLTFSTALTVEIMARPGAAGAYQMLYSIGTNYGGAGDHHLYMSDINKEELNDGLVGQATVINSGATLWPVGRMMLFGKSIRNSPAASEPQQMLTKDGINVSDVPTEFTASYSTGNRAMRIGLSNVDGLLPWQGKIVQIVIHRSYLNLAARTARIAQWNAVKGY